MQRPLCIFNQSHDDTDESDIINAQKHGLIDFIIIHY